MSIQEKREKVIEVLNKARGMELQSISQYMNQHYNLDDMDYGELAKNLKLIAIDEMRHAEMFAERIKELGGEPTSDPAGPVIKGQKVEGIYPYDSDEEDKAIDAYNEFLHVCQENNDNTSAKIFEDIIDEEWQHKSYFDNIAEHIKNLGPSYLATIAGTSASTGGTSKGFTINNAGE